jgi:hypothetical protein
MRFAHRNSGQAMLKGPPSLARLAGRLGLVKTLPASFTAALSSNTRNNLESIHHFCAVSGKQFHMLSLPADYPAGQSLVEFHPDQMPQLFEYGRRLALEGAPWRRPPPGSGPGEEETPRAGFRFVTLPQSPGAGTPGAPCPTTAP